MASFCLSKVWVRKDEEGGLEGMHSLLEVKRPSNLLEVNVRQGRGVSHIP